MSYGHCLECKEDVSNLMSFDTLCEDFIICPKCGNKMKVEYEESYDEATGEEDNWWWLEPYKE